MPHSGVLWTGIFAGPVAFLLQLQINFVLVPWACAANAQWWIHLVTLAAILVCVIGGVLAWRAWQRVGPEWPRDDAQPVARARLMAIGGILLSAMFLLVAIAQGITAVILGACQ